METFFSDAVSDTIIPPNPTDGDYNDEVIDDPALLTQSIEALTAQFNGALEDTAGLATVIYGLRHTPLTERSQVSYEAYMMAAAAYTHRHPFQLMTVSSECYPLRPTDTWAAALESITDMWRQFVAYLRDLITRIVSRIKVWFSSSVVMRNKREALLTLRQTLVDNVTLRTGILKNRLPDSFAYCQLRDGTLNVRRAACGYVDMATFVYDSLAKPFNQYASRYLKEFIDWMTPAERNTELSAFVSIAAPDVPGLNKLGVAYWSPCDALTVTFTHSGPEHLIVVTNEAVPPRGTRYTYPDRDDLLTTIDALVALLDVIVDAKMPVYDSLQLEERLSKSLSLVETAQLRDPETDMLEVVQPLVGTIQSYASFASLMAVHFDTVIDALTDVVNASIVRD